MKNVRVFLILVFVLALLSGCRSINVGGSGQIGTVTGGGSVNIPVPQATQPQ